MQQLAQVDFVVFKYLCPLRLRMQYRNAFLYLESPQTMGLSNMQKDLLEIDRSHLGLTKKLGAGLFGEVWEGVCYNCLKVGSKSVFLKVGPGAHLWAP